MTKTGMVIDMFPHILPVKYKDTLLKELPPGSYWHASVRNHPTIYDVEQRFRVMDKFEGMLQVLTTSAPPLELVFPPKKAAEMARIANDGLAELVSRYPDRFLAAAACLPMNDIDATLEEVERAINTLGLRGVQVYTPVNDRPLDAPEFMPLYEKMSRYDLPIWIHPYRPETQADYQSEPTSKYRIFHRFGWPYETTAAMARLVYSGVMERFPNLKIITHHCGGMLPFFAARAEMRPDIPESREKPLNLPRSPVDYFRRFYADTANLNPSALMCGYQFFGAGHVVLGTDMPYGTGGGEFFIRQSLDGIDQLDIPETDKAKILAGNARKLLNLSG